MEETIIVCRALIINDKKMIFLVKKTKDGFWCLPGGKLEIKDANIKDCVKREAQEELGLKIKVKDIVFVQELHKNSKRYVEFIWKAELTDKNNTKSIGKENIEKISGGELADANFFEINELQNIDVKPEFLKQQNFQIENTIFVD